MIVALSALACVMVVIGLGLVVQGTPFTRMEWGWTMVLSGTVVATGGILLAGIAVLAAGLKRVELALATAAEAPRIEPSPAAVREPIGPIVAPAAPAVEVAAEPVVETRSEVREPEPIPVQPAPVVVGTYSSGGNAYVMYSDGSINADTPRGKFSFGSLDELKRFVAEGGEEPGAGAQVA